MFLKATDEILNLFFGIRIGMWQVSGLSLVWSLVTVLRTGPIVGAVGIGSEGSHSDSFLYVENDIDKNLPLPWTEIDRCLDELKTETDNPKVTTEKQQRCFVDLGFATLQCCGRNTSCVYDFTCPRMRTSSKGNSISHDFFQKLI
jgi:hypothetical protein